MGISSRSITVTGTSSGFTLKDLRELVEATEGLPGETRVSVSSGTWSPYDSKAATITVTWREEATT